MKPPEQIKRELVAQWLDKAEADAHLCHRLAGDPPLTPGDAARAVTLADRVRNQLRTCLREELDL